MTDLRGSQTERNLMLAFASESQARNRYDFFAKQAEKEGYVQISRVFTETAEQERSHAKTFFKFLVGGEVEITASFPSGVIGTTAQNLAAAARDEHHEQAELYPGFAKVADEEGFSLVAAKLRTIALAERAHEERFLGLLEHLDNGFFQRASDTTWECAKCGYLYVGSEPPGRCPACDHPQGWFMARAKG